MKNMTKNATAIEWILLATLFFLPLQVSPVQAGAGHDHAHEEQENAKQENTEHENDGDEHDHDHGHSHDTEETEKSSVTLHEGIARQSGVTTTEAATGSIQKTLLLYGKIVADPQYVSHVRGRYPGVITHVRQTLGDTVQAGEALLEVEANESLSRYTVKAPISGIIIGSHANPGEFAGDEPLLTIASYEKVWLELNVFSQDAALVKTGQSVLLEQPLFKQLLPEQPAKPLAGNIAFINPGSGETPYLLARVPLDNADGNWVPGMMVDANVVVAEKNVPVRVDNRALQDIDGNTVVFVKKGSQYDIRPVTLGMQDTAFSEVLSGLESGEHYVVGNSYLLKADLEKSGAAHEH